MVPLSFASTSSFHPLDFNGEEFALGTGHALYWPRENALLVADLHLEKGSFYAQHGQMIPPYDSRETLERVAKALEETGARRVYTLGDNFHDSDGAERLEPYARGMLDNLTRAHDWVWITGNHDPDLPASIGGEVQRKLDIGGIILRHEAKPGEVRPELSGHFHPRLSLKVRQRHIRRPCAVRSSSGNNKSGRNISERMILPAFGAYTGGMDAAAPEIITVLQPADVIEALVPTKEKLARFALWREVKAQLQ